MTVLNKENLWGTWATVLLPINADESIDYPRLQNELDFLVQSGVSGVYSNGTAGEFFNQTEFEFDKVSEMLAVTCRRAKVPFQIGTCHMSPVISLARLERSKYLEPGAFQIILPDWLVLSTAEQHDFIQRVVEIAAPIPLVLYVPGHAKTKLAPSDFSRLADAFPQIIGVKVASGDQEWYAQMKSVSRKLAVFVPGHRLATGMKEMVGVGSYSNMACLNPTAAQKWYRLMLEALPAALEIETRILEFFKQCILPYHAAGYSDPALDKFLATVGGWSEVGTRLRWPYRGIDSGEVLKAIKIGRNIIPEFFSNN